MKKKLLISALILIFLIGASGLSVGAWYTKSQLDEKNLRVKELESNISELGSKISKLESEAATQSAEKTPEVEVEGKFSKDIVEKARKVGIKARESVVFLKVKVKGDDIGSGSGTGWFIKKGLIITNGHVVDGAEKIEVFTFNKETFTAQIINLSQYPDIAVLKTTHTKTPPLPTGSSKNLKKGQPLVQVGHPSIIGSWIIALGGFVGGEGMLTTIPVEGGNSGSPILDLDGKVVGLTDGSTPVESSELSFTEPPKTSTVYQSFPKMEMYGTHSSIEQVLEKFNAWVK